MMWCALFSIIYYTFTTVIKVLEENNYYQTPYEFYTNLKIYYGFSLFILIPIIQSYSFGIHSHKEKKIWKHGLGIIIILVLNLVTSYIFLMEGTICMIMASPLILLILSISAIVGNLVTKRKQSVIVNVMVAPIILILAVNNIQNPSAPMAEKVSSSIVIHAPVEYVWRYVVSQPENNSPSQYWLWDIGMPMPLHSATKLPKIGELRLCFFSNHLFYTSRIESIIPQKFLSYTVISQIQDPEIFQHLQFIRGEIALKSNADGTTTVTNTGLYHLLIHPTDYFNLWAKDVASHVQLRILDHIRDLSESDFKASKKKQNEHI